MMPKRILTIDDAPVIRSLIQMTLKSNNLEVDVADCADAAKHMALQNHYKLFIVDYMMPEKTGIDFIKSIRKIPEYENTPILMLTAESGEDIKAQAKQLKVSAWINKPFQPQTLLKLVNKIVDA